MIAIVSASNGKNLELAGQFQTKLTELNVKSQVISLVELNLPLYSSASDSKFAPAEVLGEVLGVMKSAQGIVFLSPEYNGGIPPVLTNFLAWTSRTSKIWREVFNSKPAVISTYSGGGGQNVMSALRSQLAFLGMTVVGRQLILSPSKALDDHSLTDVCTQLKKLSYL